jgi:hypothetical protein
MTDVKTLGLISGALARGFENEDVGKQDDIESEVRDGVNCKIHQRQR